LVEIGKGGKFKSIVIAYLKYVKMFLELFMSAHFINNSVSNTDK